MTSVGDVAVRGAVGGRGGPDTSARLAALEAAVDALTGGSQAPAADHLAFVTSHDDALDRARTVLRRAGERRALSAAHTVVALAGATGGGKSSLFNAVVGEDRVQVGARRPTTAEPVAGLAGSAAAAAPLLDWLEIRRRHLVGTEGLDGLVLVDLPDVDSVVAEHQRTVDRLAQAVDVLVWVLDPQKYADNLLHQRYLRPMATHADVTVVVLNQVDTLEPDERRDVLADLRRLLDEDGLAGVRVLSTSAVTGEGLADLRALLADIVAARTAAEARLGADARSAALDLLAEAGSPDPAGVSTRDREALAVVLAEAAGVEVVADAVARSYRMRARAATGWPVTRWIGRVKADPLRRLGLDREIVDPALVRSSMPRPTAVQRARVAGAVRDLGQAAAAGSAEPWRTWIRTAAADATDSLSDALDQAVVSTRLDSLGTPRWWRGVGALQWVALVAALGGALWLGAIAVLAYLQLPELPTARLGVVPWPTVLLVGGVLIGLVLAGIGGLAARGNARRRAGKVRKRLREAVGRVADDVVVAPVLAEVERCRAMTAAAREAAA